MTTLFPQIKRVDEDETSKIIKNVLFSNQDDVKLDKILEEFMHLTEELSCSDVDDVMEDVEIKAEPLVLDHQQRQPQPPHHHRRPSAELTNGKSNLIHHDKNGPVRNKPSDHSGGENDDDDDGDEDDDDEDSEDDDDNDDGDDDDDEDSEDDDDDDDEDDSSESEEEKQESTPPREPTSWNLDQFIKSIPAKQKQQPPPQPPPTSSVSLSQTTPALASNNHHHHHHNNNHTSIPPSSQPSSAQQTPQPKHSKHHKHQLKLELAKEKEREREREREIKRERERELKRERERERELELELERKREKDRELELEKQRQQQRELEKQQQLQQRELEKQQLQQQRELEKQQQREIEKKKQEEQRELERKQLQQQQDLQQLSQQQKRENEKDKSSDKETTCMVQIDLSKLKRIPQTKAPTPNVTGSSSMLTAKALKHEADAEKDKTKQAIKYLESCMYFVLHGQEMETTNNDTQYYSSVTPLFKHVVRMSSPTSLENLENMTNLKIHALALKCLSLLQMKMYKTRERDLSQLIKTTSTLQTSSPIQQADEVLIAVKPALLSAYKRQVAIYNYLKQAHDYWHNVEQLCDQHPALRIFFSTIESNCGPLTMVSPFPKLMDHVQCGLKLLRTS